MNIPFFDYKGFCKEINYEKLLKEVLDSGYLIGGPYIDNLESEINKLTGIKNCVSVGNATDAMEIIFDFLKLPEKTKVLVPAHTMLATASAARTANLEPIPVDVDPNTYMLEIDQLKRCNLKNVSAIMITQLNGLVADMKPIKKFCEENKINLIEDSAQGIGAFNCEGHAGSWGIGGCLSFYPAKVVGCLGDGGALITNNDDLAAFARSVRDHGRGEGLEAVNWGRNSRLDSLNARVILERLENLDSLIEKRREIANIYYEYLEPLEKISKIFLPPKFSTNSKSQGTYQNFEIKVSSREELRRYLERCGISTIKQWGGFSIAHFSKLGFDIKDYPETEKLFKELLLLPMNHMLMKEHAVYISKKILNFYGI